MTDWPTWQRIGDAQPDELVRARTETHWAAQVISAAADAVLPPADDDSHTTMEWAEDARTLRGRDLGGTHVGLRIREPAVVLVRSGVPVQSLALAGQTLASALAWTQEGLRESGNGGAELRVRDYDMPSHPVSEGGTFSAGGRGHRELEAWVSNGTAALTHFAALLPGAGPVRTWPHHFDVGGILTLAPDGPPERTPQIGFGLSPGDDHIDVPYFYVTPWPLDEGADLPSLGTGGWHRQGFTGAVLDRSAIAPLDAGEDQGDRVRAFLTEAVEVGRRLVGREP